MSRDDIIRWASEAGATEQPPYDYGAKSDSFIMRHEVLERFAVIVAESERKACARVAESLGPIDYPITAALYRGNVADAIRARGEKK